MPCNIAIQRSRLQTEMTDPDTLEEALDNLELDYRLDGDGFVVYPNQAIKGDSKRRFLRGEIILSRESNEDDAPYTAICQPEDRWAVDLIVEEYARCAAKRSFEWAGGQVLSEEFTSDGWVIRGQARAGDPQTITVTVGAGGQVNTSVEGGNLDVCNPVSHDLYTRLTGKPPTHKHNWRGMGFDVHNDQDDTGFAKVGRGQ